MEVKQVPEAFPWMDHALAELGVHEVEGTGAAARVLEYLRTTSLPPSMAATDETPWCSAFVNWCVSRAGLKGTGSAAARSWLTWGQPLAVPARGCIVVLTRDGGGHVAFYLRSSGGRVQLLGGNQGNAVCVRAYDQSRVLGYRIG